MSEVARTVIGMDHWQPERLELFDRPEWTRVVGVFDLRRPASM